MSKESAQAMIAALPQVAETTPGGTPGLQAAPTKQELDSTRFNHLAQKEAQLQKQREEFKKEREQFTSEREQYKPEQENLAKFREAKAKDPVAALRLAGFNEVDLYNFMAAQEDVSTPEERAANAAKAEIQKFTDGQAKAQATAQEMRNTQAIDNFKGSINRTILADKDKYEYCNHNGSLAEDLIFETVAAVFDADKEIISAKEAADMVESYYEEVDKAMNSLKKRQAKAVPVKQDAPLKAEVSPRPASKTLSNRTSATVASTNVSRTESRSEKRERLIQALGNMGKR